MMPFHFCTPSAPSVAFSECSCGPPGPVPALGGQRWEPQGPAHAEVNYSVVKETKHIP